MKNSTTFICVYTLVLFIFLNSLSCKIAKKSTSIPLENKQKTFVNAPVIIYKTKKDYINNIPVSLSDDKLSVVSYPDKADIYYGERFATPTLLLQGYLLDNRGIGKNSAFTSYTYSAYSQLQATPTAETCYSKIIDFEPFTEMYSCKCNRDTAEINRLIRKGLTVNCKKIK